MPAPLPVCGSASGKHGAILRDNADESHRRIIESWCGRHVATAIATMIRQQLTSPMFFSPLLLLLSSESAIIPENCAVLSLAPATHRHGGASTLRVSRSLSSSSNLFAHLTA